jgi:hypothetical protein
VSVPASKSIGAGLLGLAAAATGKGTGGTGIGGEIAAGDVARGLLRVVESDPRRGWAVAAGWMLASMME